MSPMESQKKEPYRDSSRNEQPIRYRICVEGLLDQKWAAWFEGFALYQDGKNTVLEGTVPDQSALFGRLACIRDFGLTLVSLQRLEEKPG
jgi:hypothetical protein